jgi:hypothetical protein
VVPLGGAGEAVAFAQGDFQAVDPFEEILGVGTGFLRTAGDLASGLGGAYSATRT